MKEQKQQFKFTKYFFIIYSNIKFVELNFGTQQATVNTGYEQIHLCVTVDPQEQNAHAKAIQP